MKILIDMNLSPRWIDFFANVGLHALHWSKVGPVNASDREIMAWASANDYIVMTHDLDFSAILAATQGDKPSVVQIRGDEISPDAIGTKVVLSLRQAEAELNAGALISIDAKRTRLRILPLVRP
jgi:predicted nuclease of predicted toxin-antitoxin system